MNFLTNDIVQLKRPGMCTRSIYNWAVKKYLLIKLSKLAVPLWDYKNFDVCAGEPIHVQIFS